MLAKFWSVVRYRPVPLFLCLCLVLEIAAIVIPNHGSAQQTSSLASKAVLLAFAITSISFAISLGFYFIDAWRRRSTVPDNLVFRGWLAVETVLGVPFAALCLAAGSMSLFAIFFH